MSELARFPNKIVEANGHLHWDVSRLLAEIHSGMRLYAKKHGEPASIGIDTWGIDFGLMRRDGGLVDLPYTYRNKRTEGAAESFLTKMSRERLYELTGIQILPFNTVFQLFSMVIDRDEKLLSASDLLMMADLFNYYLTGAMASEYTLASTSSLYNPLDMRWESEIIDTLRISSDLFQDIAQPGTVLGELNRETQERRVWAECPSPPSLATTRAQPSLPSQQKQTTSHT